jgi:SAM-dependent methyltransferase
MDLREQAVGIGQHRHPWETVRAEVVVRELHRLRLPPSAHLLDVGAGDCFVAQRLLDEGVVGQVVAVDANFSAEQMAMPSDARLSRTQSMPTTRQCFDCATLLDVIEHVADDVSLLGEVNQRLRPGGHVMVTVPAWPQLFSAHDDFLAHHRRYTPAMLRHSLVTAGFEVTQLGGFFRSLLVPRALGVVKEKLLGRRAVRGIAAWSGGPMVTAAIVAALRLDAALPLGLPTPGLSLLAIGRLR